MEIEDKLPLPKYQLKTVFPLGVIYATPGIKCLLGSVEIEDLLQRHGSCQWDECEEEDIYHNLEAIAHGFRVFSSFSIGAGEVALIVTEADRSATTIQLAGEY